MVIISHKHKFIYLKTYKTASTSTEVLLEEVCGKEDIITRIGNPTTERGKIYNKRARNHSRISSTINIIRHRIPLFFKHVKPRDYLRNLKEYILDGRFYKKTYGLFKKLEDHSGAYDVKSKVGNLIWDNYYKFTFERNPWDKLVSKFHFRREQIKRDKGITDFSEWIKKCALKRKPEGGFSHPKNYEKIYSINGEVVVDYIGKFENLYDDMKKVLKILGLPSNLELPFEKKTRDKKKRDYKQFYDEQAKSIIEKLYKKEIELHKYEF